MTPPWLMFLSGPLERANRSTKLRGSNIMARFTVAGVVLGIRQTPYEFKDRETGEVRKGVTRTLVLFDEASTESHELKIKESSAGLFDGVGPGQPVSVAVDVFANQRGNAAVLSVTAVDLRATAAA